MKKYKHKNKNKIKSKVPDLAAAFERELNSQIKVTVLPNNMGIMYKDYIIKELSDKNWGLFDTRSKECIDEFYLKSSALLGAKAYAQNKLTQYTEVKTVDRRFWASQVDILICQNNLKLAKDFDRYLILLNKLEHSKCKNEQYKSEISKMFRWAFV